MMAGSAAVRFASLRRSNSEWKVLLKYTAWQRPGWRLRYTGMAM